MTTDSVPIPSEFQEKRQWTGRIWRSRRIWRLIMGIFIVAVAWSVIYMLVLWPWMRNWGATGAEIKSELPGDDVVTEATIQTTKGLTIQAAPKDIYPWLLQLGVDRGGMYSYDRLENLFGLNVHTVDHIVPEYQAAQVGDFWRFTPEDYVVNPGPGLWVRELQPGRAVILCFGMENRPEDTCIDSWQFVLQPQADGSTRLLLRSRMAMEQELPIKTSYFIQFIMERKMLLGIQERAESLAAQ